MFDIISILAAEKINIMLITISFLGTLDEHDVSHLLNVNKYWIKALCQGTSNVCSFTHMQMHIL